MVDLILRPSGLNDTVTGDPLYSLQLRFHESVGETEYHTIKSVNRETAEAIIRAGEAFWLFDIPPEKERTDDELRQLFDVDTPKIVLHMQLIQVFISRMEYILSGEATIAKVREYCSDPHFMAWVRSLPGMRKKESQ